MVPYNRDKNPGLSQWSSGTMNASIVLDQPANVSFTNLDQISGRVVVRCGKSADVSSIIVKLEGESRTRLLSPGRNGDKPRAQVEYHKVYPSTFNDVRYFKEKTQRANVDVSSFFIKRRRSSHRPMFWTLLWEGNPATHYPRDNTNMRLVSR